MKRILASLAIVLLLCGEASSVTRWSYNRTTWAPIRTLQTWYLGHNLIQVVTVTDPVSKCKTVTTTYYAFWQKVAETVHTECP